VERLNAAGDTARPVFSLIMAFERGKAPALPFDLSVVKGHEDISKVVLNQCQSAEFDTVVVHSTHGFASQATDVFGSQSAVAKLQASPCSILGILSIYGNNRLGLQTAGEPRCREQRARGGAARPSDDKLGRTRVCHVRRRSGKCRRHTPLGTPSPPVGGGIQLTRPPRACFDTRDRTVHLWRFCRVLWRVGRGRRR